MSVRVCLCVCVAAGGMVWIVSLTECYKSACYGDENVARCDDMFMQQFYWQNVKIIYCCYYVVVHDFFLNLQLYKKNCQCFNILWCNTSSLKSEISLF